MTPADFLTNFAPLADTPGGVQKLRNLILQLAVRGKLVEQDPDDEPAAKLLERITTEKKQLADNGVIRKPGKPKSICETDLPFHLRNGWAVTRLSDVTLNIHYGHTASANPSITDVRMLRITDIQNNRVNWIRVPGCEINGDKLELCRLRNGDLLIARTGGTIGKSYLVKDLSVNAVFASYLIRAIPSSHIFPDYLKVFADSPLYWRQLYAASAGTGQPNVNAKSLSALVLPLPPLAEQRRIVAKVDELMRLCDALETQQTEQRAVRVRTSAAALGRLTEAKDPAEFVPAWQRLQTHFDTLFALPETIAQLRQTLLQLAVMGKLVPQDPSDEPAAKLITTIVNEKDQLVKANKIKRTKSHSSRGSKLECDSLPIGWEWVTLDELTDIGTGSTPAKTQPNYYENGTIPWITSAATNNDFITESEYFVTARAAKECRLRVYPAGSLVVALYGQGKTRGQVGQLMFDSTTNQACAVVSFFGTGIKIRDYVRLFFKKQYDELRELAAGGAQPNLSGGLIRETKVPLPPLPEQKRIVKRVCELMALCDDLEAQLARRETSAAELLDAMVAAILNGQAPVSGPTKSKTQLPTAVTPIILTARNALSCYTVDRLSREKSFRRTKHVKILSFAQAHVGVDLAIPFQRGKFGPFHPCIYDLERTAKTNKWYTAKELAKQSADGKDKVNYQKHRGIKTQVQIAAEMLGEKRAEMDRLLDLFAGLSTSQAELMATVYFAWNDLLLDGKNPTEAEIAAEFYAWHESKKERFPQAKIPEAIAWLKKNKMIPTGQGQRTQPLS